MRLMRISRPETIGNPEAYLFTIANHVLHQYMLREGTTAAMPINPADPLVLPSDPADPASQIERQQLLQELDRALGQLSCKAQAALVLYRRDTYSLEAIAAQLGISVTMVKRYLAKAILHCRQSMRDD
jgi:RNA polymerase sigma factor (sigma-70 family)